MQDDKSYSWARGMQHASDLLIRRGTAMGPLIPLLFLVPIFLGAAYLLRDLPWVSVGLTLVAVAIVFEYCRQFSRFAQTDPDRLQSEEYRYEMQKIQMVAAKGLPHPVSASDLHLPEATSNPAHPLPDLRDINLDPISPAEGEKQ